MSKTTYAAKIPDANGIIDYDHQDNAVWRDLVAQQMPNVRKFSARPYLDGLKRMKFPQDRVPQCGEISDIILPLTGWRVVPVPALIGFAQFFDMLANRKFPAASFIRNRQDFDYIQEPDIFHEIFGHTPLLCDPRFAAFSQAIGAAGVRATAKDYATLIRLYWFTIEFGLTREGGKIKALGSGLASSPTELPYSVTSTVAERRAFDVTDIMRTSYRIDIHQPVYYVLDDIDDLFVAAERDLLHDVAQAKSMGLFAPNYPPKTQHKGKTT